MSKADFEYYEAKGLVCLPATGSYWGTNYSEADDWGYYWSCTPSRSIEHSWLMYFGPGYAGTLGYYRSEGHAVRLVLLAN